jgi:uroporphyrin-III C-methyltransferase
MSATDSLAVDKATAVDATPLVPGAAGGNAAAAAAAADSKPRAAARLQRWVAWAALLLSLFACVVLIGLWQRNEHVTREAARRWTDAETRVVQLEQQLKQTQDLARDQIGKAAVLDNKLGEVIGQQGQLERMYKNIAQNGLDVVLADVENSVSIASQQLLVAGNVQGAMLALQDADTVLTRVDQASVSVLRRLLARDIERLKSVPNVDLNQMAARLDAVATGLDQLPMVSSLSPSGPLGTDVAEQQSAGSTIERLTSSGLRGWNAMKQELWALLRVRRVDAPDALLLAPARFALLSRNESVFKSDIDRSIKWLGQYYEGSAKAVSTASASLKQLAASKVIVELPSLAEALAAVRSQRSVHEARR